MQCDAKSRAGTRCGRHAIIGGTVCASHGGSAPAVKAKAAVRAEVMRWTVGTLREDPGDVLLRMVTAAVVLAEGYGSLIERKVAEAQERLGDEFDLEDVLVGEVWVTDDNGTTHKAGEYIRSLLKLQGEWSDRAVNFASKAVAAGLAERQVRLAERQGALVATVMRAVMVDPALALSDAQQAAFPAVLRRQLAEVTA